MKAIPQIALFSLLTGASQAALTASVSNTAAIITTSTTATSGTINGVDFTASGDPTFIENTTVVINNLVAPAGEFVNGAVIGFNDLFDGPGQSSLTVLATTATDTLTISISEPTNGNTNSFSTQNIPFTFTTELASTGTPVTSTDTFNAGNLTTFFVNISSTDEPITSLTYGFPTVSNDGGNSDPGIAFSTVSIPEPSSAFLSFMGVLGIISHRRR